MVMPRKRLFFYDTEFIETQGSIDLISIGIVSEDGRELYCVSREFDARNANSWVMRHVLPKLPPHYERLSRAMIRHRVQEFLKPTPADPVALWAYYGAYDHVALCWLFGAMVDLPCGMPMWTRDIKQLCAELGDPKLPDKPDDAHDALADARWVREAWVFLRRLQDSGADAEAWEAPCSRS